MFDEEVVEDRCFAPFDLWVQKKVSIAQEGFSEIILKAMQKTRYYRRIKAAVILIEERKIKMYEDYMLRKGKGKGMK